jgi:carbonic anhydrase/acetyltransferase-like protein (isoleucine patch superfamily)
MTKFDFEDGNGPVPAHRHSCGGGWVADTATVDDTAYVGLNARVFGDARVSENAEVSGYARVFGDAVVTDSARVSGNARVSDD